MPKFLILSSLLLAASAFSQNQQLAQKNWNQMLSNVHYIDSICNITTKSTMNLGSKKMKVVEKTTGAGKSKQKTKVRNRNGQIYSKNTYKVNGEQKIKVLTLNGEIIMVKFNYRWYSSSLKSGIYSTRNKVKFMRTSDQWLYTNKGKNKLMDEKEKLRKQKVAIKEYVTLK